MTLSERLRTASRAESQRSMEVLARSLYREIKAANLGDREVIVLATKLIGQVTDDARESEQERARD